MSTEQLAVDPFARILLSAYLAAAADAGLEDGADPLLVGQPSGQHVVG